MNALVITIMLMATCMFFVFLIFVVSNLNQDEVSRLAAERRKSLEGTDAEQCG